MESGAGLCAGSPRAHKGMREGPRRWPRSRRPLLHRKVLQVQVCALRTSRVPREALPRLGAEGRAAKSGSVAKFAANFNPRNGRARVSEMLAKAAIKFCSLFRAEAK